MRIIVVTGLLSVSMGAIASEERREIEDAEPRREVQEAESRDADPNGPDDETRHQVEDAEPRHKVLDAERRNSR